MAETQAQRQLKNLSQNMKKTQLGVLFAKKLFTDPKSLSVKQITTTMKALGLDIPKEVELTADVAQVIVSGQAINTALNTAQDIGSVTNVVAGSIKTMNAIADKNGWIDEDSASVVSYGTNVAMIVASGGSDVKAWVNLALDFSSTVAAKQGLADINAYKDLKSKYSLMMTTQGKILADTFLDYQKGNISIYGVISKMAVETPDLWPQVVKPGSPFTQMFPELMMLPVVDKSISGYGTSSIWGNWPWPANGSYVIASWSSTKSLQYLSIDKMTKEEAAEYFFNILLKPWLTGYSIANEEVLAQGNMSMKNVAALSYLVNPQGEISAKDNYVSMLLGANLTPYDFDDFILDNIASQFLEDNYKGIDHAFVERAVSVGLSTQNKGFNAYNKDADIMRMKLEQVKESDSIWELVQYPYIYKKLQSYMDFQKVSFEIDPSYGGKINEKFSVSSVTAWRKLHNYIAVINMLTNFREDSYLKNTKYAQSLMPFMPSINEFEGLVKKLSYVSTTRSVNILALRQIAEMLGTTPSKLQKLTGSKDVGPAIFKIS